MKNYFRIVLLLLFISFLAACSTTESMRDMAADRARSYVLHKFPNMSIENKTIIRYTYPEILTSPILTSALDSDNPNNTITNYKQVGFAWDFEKPKVKLVVMGSSNINLLAWRPIKVIIIPIEKLKESNFFDQLYSEDSARM